MDKPKIVLLGMGLSGQDLTPAHLEMIRCADLLVGGRRQLAPFTDLPMEKHTIRGNLEETLSLLRKRRPHQRIVVIASGDPLLFGIGGRIIRELGTEHVRVIPNTSSIATAFARIGEPWEEAALVSLHGRKDNGPLAAALKSKALVAVLTDKRHAPDWLAGWLLEKGMAAARMAVFECLGLPEEKFGWYTLDEAAAGVFGEPNLVVIKTEANTAGLELRIGLEDAAYVHENGLITKPEVRAVTLAKLALTSGLTLWDLGAGSGSVGIEASLLLGHGRVVAVEEKAGRVAQIRENARRLGAYNLEVVHAKLPDGLDALPRPDRIFIGGGGRELATILGQALGCLKPGGVLVVNTVLLDNLVQAGSMLTTGGMTVEVVQVQISRSKGMPWSQRMAAENPVWIVTGSAKGGSNNESH